MARVPNNPKIYHITHVDNLSSIIEEGAIWSDAKRLGEDSECKLVGMSHIKKRRLTEIEVGCHPGTFVGAYTPFYLCPRSIMLYILHKGNNPDIEYKEGQGPIVHLEADLRECVEYAEANGILWACSTLNAGAKYQSDRFFNDLLHLDRVNWAAVQTDSWGGDSQLKTQKQAEFLFHDTFPWHLIRRIGVCDQRRKTHVDSVLKGLKDPPEVQIKRGWYY